MTQFLLVTRDSRPTNTASGGMLEIHKNTVRDGVLEPQNGDAVLARDP
jgi:hypothetical protein